MFLFSKIKMYLLIAAGVALAVVSAFLRGKSEGKHQAEYEAQDKRLDDLLAAKEVKDDVEILDDVGLSRRAGKWVREADGE